MIRDGLLMFTGVGTAGFAPNSSTGDNLAPNSIDTSPLGLPTGSGGAGTTGYNSGSAINAGRDLGIGGEIWFQVLTTVAATSGGATNVIFDFVTDAAATLASVVHSTGVGILLSSPIFAKAALVAGFFYRAQLPAALTYLQFLGLNVNVATTSLTTGTFEGSLLMNIQASDLYLSGFNVQ